MKRFRKYFLKQDGSPLPIMEELGNTNADLLGTIKLTKNVFKLTLPSPAYGN